MSKTHSVIVILRCTLLKHANFKHTDFNQSYTLVNCVDVFHWLIVHFTVACLVAKLLKRSKAKGDLMMIQTLLLFKYKLLSKLDTGLYHNAVTFRLTPNQKFGN